MSPWTLTHSVGTGDLFDADSFWSDDRRAALTTVYHAWWGSLGTQAVIDVMRACPAYRHVEHKGCSYPTEIKPGSVVTLRDQPIFHRLTYHGSAFLNAPLDCDAPRDLPERFIYIQPSTPKNGPNCDRWFRDEEWTSVIETLKQWYAVGLVVNIPGGKATVPDHPLLINWTGRTSLPQAVETLKRAEGYIGVDSCMAILAAQLFTPDRLKIRTNNPYVIDYPDAHYPPQTDYSFLYPRFDRPPHNPSRPPRLPGTVVDLRVNALIGGRTYGGGSRVEVDADRAAQMLAASQAVEVDPETLELP